jgi:ribosomal protein S18 acetylase RimI-like enzyme
MPLPILSARHEPSRDDLVRLFHRTETAWIEHLAEGEQLDAGGTAYTNPDLPKVDDANHLRDAALPPGLSPEEAVAQVNAHFAEKGTRCLYWVMNPSAPAAQTQPLIDHLLATHHRPHLNDILYLRSTPHVPIAQAPNLTIIPARASYRHAEQITREVVNQRHGGCEQLIQAGLQHLDDPHVDALLALKDNQPVGYCAVLAVGELGRIEHVHVSPDHRRQHVGQTLMSRALEICARSLFKHVFICCMPTNQAAQPLYRKLGFEKIADYTIYLAPNPDVTHP